MKGTFKHIQKGPLMLLGLGIFGALAISSCSTAPPANAGKIGPDYDSTLSDSVRMQEAMTRAVR